MRSYRWGLFLPVFFPALVWAEKVTPATADPLALSSYAQVALGLLLVLLAFAAVVYLLQRVPGFRGKRGGSMRVVDAIALGARDRVVLLQVGKIQVLVGLTPGRMEALHVITDPHAAGTVSDFSAELAQTIKQPEGAS
jgi:flagellar protein FliO/FliZ